MRSARYAGTLIPLILVVVFGLALWQATKNGLTWERPLTYGLTMLSITLGLEALVRMARDSVGENPSLFLLTIIYQKAALLVLMAGVLLTSLSDLVGWISAPDALLFGLLVSSCASIVIVNLVLFFGGRWGLLEAEADPVPFRALLKGKRKGE